MKTITFYKSLLFCILFPCFCASCSQDWLDVRPNKRSLVPESVSDFQGLLDNQQTMNANLPICGELASDNHYITDITFTAEPRNYPIDIYRWTKELRHTVVGDWNNSYKKILVDNVVLEGINKIKAESETLKEILDDIRGQALFNRALTLFWLLQTYAPPYNEETAEKQFGVPVRLEADVSILPKRNTVKEGYDLIIKDLKESLTLLPIKPKILTRASQAAAHALLSRIYLSMGDYENSLLSATACLDINDSLLNYNTIPASRNFIGRYNIEVIYHTNYSPSFLQNAGLIDQDIYNSYHINDLRKTRFYTRNATNGAIKFKGTYESAASRFFNGFATDEIFLTRAECLARLGRTEDALLSLNTLMRARWDNTVTYLDYTATSPEAALFIILEERKKELVFRGTRWMDLRRLNQDPRFAITLSRTIAGTTYTLEPNSLRYTLPIPDDIIEMTGMSQNPGWE